MVPVIGNCNDIEYNRLRYTDVRRHPFMINVIHIQEI